MTGGRYFCLLLHEAMLASCRFADFTQHHPLLAGLKGLKVLRGVEPYAV